RRRGRRGVRPGGAGAGDGQLGLDGPAVGRRRRPGAQEPGGPHQPGDGRGLLPRRPAAGDGQRGPHGGAVEGDVGAGGAGALTGGAVTPGAGGRPMGGKVVLVTGATSGIGAVTARELARRGATVVAVARNPGRAAALLECIQAETPGAAAET